MKSFMLDFFDLIYRVIFVIHHLSLAVSEPHEKYNIKLLVLLESLDV